LKGREWWKQLEDFLFQYRMTPHTVTGETPGEMLMGRTLRGKIPKQEIPDDRPTGADWQLMVRARDKEMKVRQKEYADTK
jgi:hypothetical protein